MPAIPGWLHKQQEYPNSQRAIIAKEERAWLQLGTELWNLSDKALANIQPSGLGINPWKAGPSPQLGQDWAGQGRDPPG